MQQSLLVFDIKGRNAHFRDVSTNSSSLSYFAPPRTTVVGLLECLLGIEEPSGLFSPEICDIAVGVESPLRKIMIPMKYLKISEGTIKRERALVPFQVVRREDDGDVVYRIYLRHKDEKIIDEIESLVKNQEMNFPLYLGRAGFGCQTEYVGRTTDYCESMEGNVLFSTVIPKDIIGTIDFSKDAEERRRYVKEKKPRVLDKERNLLEIREYIVPTNPKGILLKSVASPYTAVKVGGRQFNIAWL